MEKERRYYNPELDPEKHETPFLQPDETDKGETEEERGELKTLPEKKIEEKA